MSASAPLPDSAAQLPADAYYHLIHSLQRTLPPPLSDSPEDRVRRDHAAIARIAALAPANAAEADIAAVYVAASEQWKDCLRLVQEPETSAVWAMKCRAQANSMMRQAQSALRLLLRMQAIRQKTEANADVREREAWTEHCAIGMMAQALSPPYSVSSADQISHGPGNETMMRLEAVAPADATSWRDSAVMAAHCPD